MATPIASVPWRDFLNKHPICKRLKENNAKDSSHKQQNDAKSLVHVCGSDLYIWDNSEGRLLHCNLKTISAVEDEVEQGRPPSISDLCRGDRNQKTNLPQYQKLLLSDAFSLDVDEISTNRCGSHIVVWGSSCIRVVELPRRWGRNAMFEGGKETITCRTICVGERAFTGSSSTRVRQVSWHPGSKTDSHLAVLTSDNTFSVYDIQEPDQPLSIVGVNTGDVSLSQSPSKTFVGAALGETGVAFDFGSPVMVRPKERGVLVSNKVSAVEVWPVYVVRGSGDVMLLYSHASQFRQLQLPVQGPLVMCPPADDNYGVDACSILCLPTPFPVIVISTCEGRVHHCVQLPHSSDEESLRSESSFLGPSPSTHTLYEHLPEPTLYVVETAELELCLSLPRLDGDEAPLEDDFMCPVRLRKDGCSPDRYHCAHAAGVHSVALPWINSIQQFILGGDSMGFDLQEEEECVVEHVMCTKPLHSCPTSPVVGMDVVTDPSLGPTLVILSSDYEFTALPIGLQYQMSSSRSLNSDDAGVSVSSPLRRHSREPFNQRVAQILQKKASNPLLKFSSNTELSQQDCFQLLSRATQVLREEYIQRQDQARQEIDTRIAVLQELKDHQLQDSKRLVDSRLMLREHARSVAESVETCKENHERLLKRLESILHKLQSRVPTLSEAEKHMMKELGKIKDNLQLYRQNIEQVRTKQEYQDKQITKSGKTGGLNLQPKQLSQIHGVLKEESDDIEELKKDISRLNISLS